jgi:hypothetical protein
VKRSGNRFFRTSSAITFRAITRFAGASCAGMPRGRRGRSSKMRSVGSASAAMKPLPAVSTRAHFSLKLSMSFLLATSGLRSPSEEKFWRMTATIRLARTKRPMSINVMKKP